MEIRTMVHAVSDYASSRLTSLIFFYYLTVALYVFMGKKNILIAVSCFFRNISLSYFSSIYNHAALSDLSIVVKDNLLYLVFQMIIPLCCST